jgi:DNA-binding NtrC family response regulator
MPSSNPKTAQEPIRILHVDDDPSILQISKLMLTDIEKAFTIDSAFSVNEAFSKLSETDYDIIISDYEMPQKDGLTFLREIKNKGLEKPFILFTGKGREEVAIQALNLGASGYYNKQGPRNRLRRISPWNQNFSYRL